MSSMGCLWYSLSMASMVCLWYSLSMVRRHQLWQVWAGSNANEGPPASMAFLNQNNSIAIEKVVIDWLF